MPIKYVKMEQLAEEVFRRKAAGETNREIGEHFGLSKYQIKQLVARQNRKRRREAKEGYVARSKGRPRNTPMSEEKIRQKQVKDLEMQVELLRNFLSEVGRR
ncbi:MAG: hypothetical protein IJ043_07800 [Clostridia bacterium]|nr:hypothetical protein [Clostridia bacterium]